MTHTCASMTWHTSWIAGANQIHCTTQNFCGAQWASKPWFDTIHQTKQIDMVTAFWLEPLALYQTHDNQRLPGQSLLLLPLTTSSSSSSSSSWSWSSSPSSSWSSAVVTWTQKRPLMTKQTFPPPHIMFQWRLFYFHDVARKRSTIFWQKSETKKCSAFNYQSSNDPPVFFVFIEGRNNCPIAATDWDILLEIILFLLCANWTGQLNLCLCNEQLMITKHSNLDLTWPFKTLTWHYKNEFSEDLTLSKMLKRKGNTIRTQQ